MLSLSSTIQQYKNRVDNSPRLFVEIAESSQFYSLRGSSFGGETYRNLIESMSPVSQSMPRVSGLAPANNFSLSLLNQGLQSDTVLGSYPNLTNQEVNVYLGFATSSGREPASSTEAALLYRGRIDNWGADRRCVEINIIDSSPFNNYNFPRRTFKREDFAGLPAGTDGAPIPYVYGDFMIGGGDVEFQTMRPTPLIMADEGQAKYVLADHGVHIFQATYPGYQPHVYFPQIGEAAQIVSAGSDVIEYSAGESFGGATRATLRLKKNLHLELNHWPQQLSPDLQNSPTNAKNALVHNSTSVCTLNSTSDVLAVRLNGPPRLGSDLSLSTDVDCRFHIRTYIKSVNGLGIQLGIYNHETGAYTWSSTGSLKDTINTWNNSTDMIEHLLTTTGKGVGWGMLPNLSLICKSHSTGEVEIAGLICYIRFQGEAKIGRYNTVSRPASGSEVGFVGMSGYYGYDVRWKPGPGMGLMVTKIPQIQNIPENMTTLYAGCKGAVSTGAGFLENPIDIIEDIWNHRLSLDSSGLSSGAFDAAITALDRKAIIHAFWMGQEVDFISFLSQSAAQSRTRYYFDEYDRLTPKVYSSDPNFSVSGSSIPAAGDIFTYNPTKLGSGSTAQYLENMILKDTFRVTETDAAEIKNEFHFKYGMNYMTGKFDGEAWVNNSAGNLSAGLDNVVARCSASRTNQKVTTRLTMELDLVQDEQVASRLVRYYADQLTNPKKVVSFRTKLNALGHQRGDIINVRDPLINNIVTDYENKRWELLYKAFIPPVKSDPASGSFEIAVVEI